jgi:hypothetical protein
MDPAPNLDQRKSDAKKDVDQENKISVIEKRLQKA